MRRAAGAGAAQALPSPASRTSPTRRHRTPAHTRFQTACPAFPGSRWAATRRGRLVHTPQGAAPAAAAAEAHSSRRWTSLKRAGSDMHGGDSPSLRAAGRPDACVRHPAALDASKRASGPLRADNAAGTGRWQAQGRDERIQQACHRTAHAQPAAQGQASPCRSTAAQRCPGTPRYAYRRARCPPFPCPSPWRRLKCVAARRQCLTCTQKKTMGTSPSHVGYARTDAPSQLHSPVTRERSATQRRGRASSVLTTCPDALPSRDRSSCVFALWVAYA